MMIIKLSMFFKKVAFDAQPLTDDFVGQAKILLKVLDAEIYTHLSLSEET